MRRNRSVIQHSRLVRGFLLMWLCGLSAPVASQPATEINDLTIAVESQDFDLYESMAGRGTTPASQLESIIADSDTIATTRLRDYSAVSDEMRRHPPDADWLVWRRTLDSLGYSPLDQINRDSVESLKLAWRAPLAPGNSMATPFIHNGVMFLYGAGDVLMALDASNGELLWRYRHVGTEVTDSKFGVALYEELVLVPTSDLRLVALDARSGAVVWDHAIRYHGSGDYNLRAAPLVAAGQLIQGVNASRVPGGGFIIAVDVRTGEETWRFQTLAHPGEPGGNSWNDLPLAQRRGGSVWIAGSYDSELDLVFFGVAPTYNTGPLLQASPLPGVNNDALYTNSTLALRPATGELVWYFQHMPNDQFDHDWVFERSILELEIEGLRKKVVVTAGKPALFDVLNAASGQYLFSIDSGIQNLVSEIDPNSGAKTLNAAVIPNAESSRLVCPLYQGGRGWPATSINKSAGLLFVPLFDVCMQTQLTGQGALLTSGLQMDPVPAPGSNGQFGRLQAIDLNRREIAWQYTQELPPSSAALATGGGLVFQGFLDQSFKAFDQFTGELVWETTLDVIPASFPVSYSVDGKQYIALVGGQLNRHTGIWLGLMASFTGYRMPEPGIPAIWVYALD